MAKHKVFMFFGILFLFLGATIVFNSFSGITGFAVYEDVDLDYGIIIGVWFVLTGILLAVYRKKEKNAEEKK
jgi:uncharacterized membrane protein